jgi:CheY-like chemotaxis protein
MAQRSRDRAAQGSGEGTGSGDDGTRIGAEDLGRAEEPGPRGFDPADGGRLGTVVLVVDDDAVVRAVVARALTLAHFEVTTAASGRDAMRLVADGRVRPAVLITDIEMPEMNGVELAARVLALRPAVRVVMMTGDADRARSARGHPSIVDTVLLKPVRLEELVTAVGAAATSVGTR